MPSLDSLSLLTQKLRRATSTSDIGQAFFDLARELEFEELSILGVLGGGLTTLFATTRDVQQLAVEQLNRAKVDDLPFIASPSHDLADAHSSGIVIPVHEHGQLSWCVCAMGRVPNLSVRAKLMLGAAAYAAHARCQSLGMQKKKSLDWGLSARERTCLDFVSLGKTDAEIGKILQISARTVRFHVHNGKIKLGVTTRVQAAAKLSAAQH